MTTSPLTLPLLTAGMRAACKESSRWIGSSSPNPPVGAAALSAAGAILAVASHQRAGGPHGELAVLQRCEVLGLTEQIHTLCVMLEPCNHIGRTGACSEAIIATGIRHVAVGTTDPNRLVKGGGIARLREAGIDVKEGVGANACQKVMHAFLFKAKTERPFLTIKRAFDSAGSMIPPKGQKTFTSQSSLVLAHRMRKKADAIITGSGTIVHDSPLFDVRHVTDFADKRRVLAILDRRRRVSQNYIDAAATRGLDVRLYEDLDTCVKDLSSLGVQDILVEAGPLLSSEILKSRLWTLQVDIVSGTEDSVKVNVRDTEEVPFDSTEIDLDELLPT